MPSGSKSHSRDISANVPTRSPPAAIGRFLTTPPDGRTFSSSRSPGVVRLAGRGVIGPKIPNAPPHRRTEGVCVGCTSCQWNPARFEAAVGPAIPAGGPCPFSPDGITLAGASPATSRIASHRGKDPGGTPVASLPASDSGRVQGRPGASGCVTGDPRASFGGREARRGRSRLSAVLCYQSSKAAGSACRSRLPACQVSGLAIRFRSVRPVRRRDSSAAIFRCAVARSARLMVRSSAVSAVMRASPPVGCRRPVRRSVGFSAFWEAGFRLV